MWPHESRCLVGGKEALLKLPSLLLCLTYLPSQHLLLMNIGSLNSGSWNSGSWSANP